jgi:hypothetical protein
MTVRDVAIVALAALGLAATPVGSALPPQTGATRTVHLPVIIEQIFAWQQQVLAHEPGKFDDAARSIGSWPPDKLGDTIGCLVEIRAKVADLDRVRPDWRETSEPKAWEVSNCQDVPLTPSTLRIMAPFASRDPRAAAAFFKRATVLHSDIALLAADDASRHSGPGNIVYVEDGRVIGQGNITIHWGLGRRLVNLVSVSPADDPFVQRWYHATMALMLGVGALADASPHVAAAVIVLPNNASVLFEAGRYSEAMVRALPTVPLAMARDTRGLGGRRRDAVSQFRRALRLDPTHVEARVRLGHALLALGWAEEASRDLAAAYDAVADSRLAYLAAMFLGRAEELSGQLESAATRYQRAAARCSTAQSPWLALSRLARQSGDAVAARRHLQNVLSRGADGLATDPWWTYHEWQVQDPDMLMKEVRALARMEPKS